MKTTQLTCSEAAVSYVCIRPPAIYCLTDQSMSGKRGIVDVSVESASIENN